MPRGGWKLVISNACGIAISATWWRPHMGCHWGLNPDCNWDDPFWVKSTSNFFLQWTNWKAYSENQKVFFFPKTWKASFAHMHFSRINWAVAHLLLLGFRVTPFVQWRFLANNKLGYKWNSFCDCVFVPKGGGTLTIFIYYWIHSEKYSCTIG